MAVEKSVLGGRHGPPGVGVLLVLGNSHGRVACHGASGQCVPEQPQDIPIDRSSDLDVARMYDCAEQRTSAQAVRVDQPTHEATEALWNLRSGIGFSERDQSPGSYCCPFGERKIGAKKQGARHA